MQGGPGPLPGDGGRRRFRSARRINSSALTPIGGRFDQRNFAAATAHPRSNTEQYNGMLKGTYDLLLARQAEADANRAEIEACRDYWIARVQLERSRGQVDRTTANTSHGRCKMITRREAIVCGAAALASGQASSKRLPRALRQPVLRHPQKLRLQATINQW